MNDSVINEYVHVMEVIPRTDLGGWHILYEPFDFPCCIDTLLGTIYNNLHTSLGSFQGTLHKSLWRIGGVSRHLPLEVMGVFHASTNAVKIWWEGVTYPEHFLCVSYETGKVAEENINWKKYGF